MAEIFEIKPSEPGNPYNAVVADDGASITPFESGYIRIEPPVIVGQLYLDILKDNAEVRLEPWLQTQNATVLEFQALETAAIAADETSRVHETVQLLIDWLGVADSEAKFRKYFTRT